MERVWKRQAAEKAAQFVESGMIVGLGSGTTMAEVVKCLSKCKVRALFVPASNLIERLAKRSGLRLTDLEKNPNLDLHIDGADEVDPKFNMIKGRGGALTREKILAKASKHVVIVVDRTKLVHRLGERSPVPVEVLPFAAGLAQRRLKRFGNVKLRKRPDGGPYATDNRNYIFDVKCETISNPKKLELELNAIPGVVENGIFTGLADEVVVGHEKGVSIVKSRQEIIELLSGKSS